VSGLLHKPFGATTSAVCAVYANTQQAVAAAMPATSILGISLVRQTHAAHCLAKHVKPPSSLLSAFLGRTWSHDPAAKHVHPTQGQCSTDASHNQYVS